MIDRCIQSGIEWHGWGRSDQAGQGGRADGQRIMVLGELTSRRPAITLRVGGRKDLAWRSPS